MYLSYVVCPKLYKQFKVDESSFVDIEMCRACKSHKNKGIFSNYIGCNFWGDEVKLKIINNF